MIPDFDFPEILEVMDVPKTYHPLQCYIWKHVFS